MKQLSIGVTLLLTAVTSATAGELIRTQGERIDGQYMVVFRDGVPARQAAPQLAGLQGARVEKIWEHAVNGALLSGMTETAALALAANPTVAWVEEDGSSWLEPLVSPPQPVWVFQTSPVWGLNRIDERTRPLDTAYIYDSEGDGEGIHAYVLDSGIRTTHAEFEGRASNDHDTIGDGQNGGNCNGHGTHVAAILGGKTYGVAKKVRLHGVRVVDCGGFQVNSSITDGVNWVTANAERPAVVNMSLRTAASATLDAAVNNSVASGIFYAVAAGNDNGANACNVSPARAAQAYTVAATTSSDARAAYSNLGTCVAIFGPGSGILSAWHTSDSATQTLDGTSMATPHVAGLAARILDENPAWTVSQVKSALTSTATCNVVSNAGAGSPNRLAWKAGFGYRMDLTVEAVLFAGRRAFLYWGGSCAANVDVFRDGVKILTTANDGGHQDNIGGSEPASFNYWVCDAGSTTWYETATCSNVATAHF